MNITISISQDHENEVQNILAWAHKQSWTKSKFICNAIIHYAQYLQSDQNGSTSSGNSAGSSLLSEDMLRRLIREELHSKSASERSSDSKVHEKGKKNPTSKAAKEKLAPKEPPVDTLQHNEPVEDVQLEVPVPESSTGMSNAISQEEQELYDLINAGLGIE